MFSTIAKIEKLQVTLAAEIREYSRSQEKEWRKIPWMALQADGRSGYSDIYQYAYRHGLWVLDFMSDYSPFVDCATGKIVDHERKREPDWRVADLSHNLERLDTAKILEEMKRRVDEPPFNKSKKEYEERAAWRTKFASELGLTPVYTRRKKK